MQRIIKMNYFFFAIFVAIITILVNGILLNMLSNYPRIIFLLRNLSVFIVLALYIWKLKLCNKIPQEDKTDETKTL